MWFYGGGDENREVGVNYEKNGAVGWTQVVRRRKSASSE